jgi:ABC-type branched-subunit amino acid transport system substrate-binding protein
MLKILLVLGNQQIINRDNNNPFRDIDGKIDEENFISHTSNRIIGIERWLFSVEKLENPTREKFLETIEHKIFNVVIIVGHSIRNVNGIDGTIIINDSQNVSDRSVTIEQLTRPFQISVSRKNRHRRLQLVVLAGCSSSAAARALVADNIGVPSVISFRLPVTPSVVRQFLSVLFRQWIVESKSLEIAVNEARDALGSDNGICPGAVTMPMLSVANNKEVNQSLMFSEFVSSSFKGRLLKGLISIPLVAPAYEKILIPLVAHAYENILIPLLSFCYRNINRLRSLIFALVVVLVSVLIIWQQDELKKSLATNVCQSNQSFPSFLCQSHKKDQPPIPPTPSPVIQSSIGDRPLFSNKFSLTTNKNNGITAFKKNKYDVAHKKFQDAHEENRIDPEPVIYGNNAQVLGKVPDQTKSLTIPITSSATSGFSTHVEVLRGAALAQMEINKKADISINGEQKKVLLKIYLDDNNPAKANEVATEIAANYRQVVGHVDSKISLQVASIYENKEVIMLTATSSVSGLGQKKYRYIARTMPDAEVMAKYLAEHISEIGKKKIAVCRHGDDAGIIFEGLISKELRSKKIDVLNDCNMSAKSFSAEKVINKMIKQDHIDGLLIYTHLNEADDLKAFTDIVQAVKKYNEQGKVSLFGSHSLISTDLINLGKNANLTNLNDMAFVTPKHPDILANSKPLKFTQDFKSIFGIEPTWRDMMAYDAVKAIAYGLNRSNGDNETLRIKLHSKVKIADGSSAPIEFSTSGNRYLVPLITYFKCNNNTCKFELSKDQPTITTK